MIGIGEDAMGRGRSGRGRRQGPAWMRWGRAAALAGLVVGVAPALAEVPASSPGQPAGAALTVRGTASVDQPPDAAAVTVSVVTRGAGLAAAVRSHTGRVAAARAVLDRLAAGGVSVDAGAFSLGEEPAPVAPGDRSGQRAPVARAETRFDLVIHDLGKLDAMLGEIAAAGLFEVESARYTVADVAAATDRARRAAMADARHQAETYAEAGGLRLDAIERISDADAAGIDLPVPAPMLKARAASVGATPPRSLSFTGSVTVTWRAVPR